MVEKDQRKACCTTTSTRRRRRYYSRKVRVMSSAKENLRCTIQSRRIARGQNTIDVSGDRRAQNNETLSSQDEEKRRIRRERNKLAANKCRKRKREKVESLEKTASDLLESNKLLEKDIARMREELKGLASILQKHDCQLNKT